MRYGAVSHCLCLPTCCMQEGALSPQETNIRQALSQQCSWNDDEDLTDEPSEHWLEVGRGRGEGREEGKGAERGGGGREVVELCGLPCLCPGECLSGEP